MTDLRIKIDSNKECQEAQELLFQLGKSWSCAGYNYSYPQKDIWLHTSATQIFWCHDSEISTHDVRHKKIVTLEDLRTMVILHRNDLNDRTHIYTASNGEDLSCVLCGEWWHIFSGDRWGKFSHINSDTAKSIFPIQKQPFVVAGSDHFTAEAQSAGETDPFLKEYLTPDFRLMLASDPHPSWIDVPDGAQIALLWDEGTPGQVIEFYREDNVYFSNEKHEWRRGMNYQGKCKTHSKVVWQRDPQPQSDSNSDLPSSIEFAPIETVYHYSASINTARGTVSYDGVITFPGRITGIEDYQKVRAEIAKDGNVAPDAVNVHSLTIVG